jgi:heme exporter protein A
MRLILDNVTKLFPGRKVFENISIELGDNDKIVITGPNGSGKTTLINVICSTVPKTSGKITFELDGKTYIGAEMLQFIGIVSPDLFFYDELTANENLQFFARVSGIGQHNFDEELSKMGLKGRGNDLVKSYSSGMKQRLKYILALIKNPPLMLLDEPTANLDKAGKAIVSDIIQSRNAGITVIATNEPDEFKFSERKIELG